VIAALTWFLMTSKSGKDSKPGKDAAAAKAGPPPA
jgi:hypothetical protein